MLSARRRSNTAGVIERKKARLLVLFVFFSFALIPTFFKTLFLFLPHRRRNFQQQNQSCRSPPRPSVSIIGGERENAAKREEIRSKAKVLPCSRLPSSHRPNGSMLSRSLLLSRPSPRSLFPSNYPPHDDRFPPHWAQPRDEEGSREVRRVGRSFFGRQSLKVCRSNVFPRLVGGASEEELEAAAAASRAPPSFSASSAERVRASQSPRRCEQMEKSNFRAP